MGKVILFVRVSTLQQHLESQEDALRRAAIADGYSENDFIIIGKKESAIKLDEEEREGLNELKKYLAEENIECVYIFELSRLSRRPLILYSIREQLLKAKVQLRCLNPQFSLLNSDRSQYDNMASVIFSLFGAMAEQEMIEKKERFHRGRGRLAQEGKYNGGNIPFGYKIDKERGNLIVIDEDEATLVREVFNLYENGMSQPQLAKEYLRRGIKKLTISFINNILNNKRYTGDKHCYPGSSFERAYPIIITPEQYERCRVIANANNTLANKTRNIYYAHKLIVCNKCGCYWSASGSKVLYRCYDAFNPSRDYDNYKTPRCTCRIGISINIMDSILWHVSKEAEVQYILTTAAKDKSKYEQELNNLYQKLSVIDTRLSELDNKRSRIVDAYIDGDLTKAKRDEKFALLESQRKEILLDQVHFQNSVDHITALLCDLTHNYGLEDVNTIVDHLERNMILRDRIYSITDDEERYRIVHRHIKKVSLINDEIEFEFKIGKKLAKTRFITVELYNGEIKYFQFIPNAGKGGIVLQATKDGVAFEKISMQYLERYYDTRKRKRQLEIRKKNIHNRKMLFPTDKYIIGYSDLAEFLKVSIGTAHRWVEKKKLLKPAILTLYKKEVVFDKRICIRIIKEEAKKNVWIAKLLEGLR